VECQSLIRSSILQRDLQAKNAATRVCQDFIADIIFHKQQKKKQQEALLRAALELRTNVGTSDAQALMRRSVVLQDEYDGKSLGYHSSHSLRADVSAPVPVNSAQPLSPTGRPGTPQRVLSPAGLSPKKGESVRTERPVWVDDSASNVCMICQHPFTLTNRKHHCRHCGCLVDAQCTEKRPLPSLGYNDPVIVCKRCIIRFFS